MARYLLAACPLSGHVMPMVHIGKDLQRRGHDVTVVTGARYVPHVDSAGLFAIPVAGMAGIESPHREPAAVRLPALVRRLMAGRSELRSVFIAPLRAQYLALGELLANESFDAVLADIAFTGVLPLLLNDGPRPPVFLCGLGPLTVSSKDTPPFGMAWQPEAGMDYRRMTAVAHRVLFGDVQAQFSRALRSTGARPAPVFVADWVRLADGLLQLSVPGFEYPRSDLPTNVTFVGPVLPDAGPAFERPSWWNDVLAARLVVHVTQGTLDNVDLDQLIGPTLTALAHRDDILVLASTAARQGQSMDSAVPRNARVIEWLPYPELMPYVDVMITNGGYGGVHHALREGVPLIVAGETSDKAEIAARVQYSGAGINLGTAAPSAAQIADAVDRILRDANYRLAANRLSVEIGRTNPLDAIANMLMSLQRVTSSDSTVA